MQPDGGFCFIKVEYIILKLKNVRNQRYSHSASHYLGRAEFCHIPELWLDSDEKTVYPFVSDLTYTNDVITCSTVMLQCYR